MVKKTQKMPADNVTIFRRCKFRQINGRQQTLNNELGGNKI